jgi:hypothetical protein
MAHVALRGLEARADRRELSEQADARSEENPDRQHGTASLEVKLTLSVAASEMRA